MFPCPMAAASILVYKEEKLDGIRKLLKRVFDYKRFRPKNMKAEPASIPASMAPATVSGHNSLVQANPSISSPNIWGKFEI